MALLLSSGIHAEQSKDFGGKYTAHYNAFTADNLIPAVAKRYNIKRSKKRALLNISVLKKVPDAASKPTYAVIKGTATNLNQQLRELTFQEISEQSAIYYIAETLVDNAETLKYDLEITPEGEIAAYTLTFKQTFYTE